MDIDNKINPVKIIKINIVIDYENYKSIQRI